MSRAAGARAETFLPEPDRLWIRYAPRAWKAGPRGELRWLDLARGALGPVGPDHPPPALEVPPGPFDDVLYLPPVHPGLGDARDGAAAEVAAQGTPVLVQLLAGEPAPDADGVVPVYDLLEPLLAARTEELARLPAGAAAVWPLVPGLTDAPELREEGCRRLAQAGVAVVQGVAPSLAPAERRRLLEETGRGDDDEAFEALFHGPGADLRSFARAAHGHGLRAFLPRPLPRPPLAGAAEREAAGLLALAGELHLRLGEEGRSQSCFRAARFVDRTRFDLRALAREGNLPVLPWLDEEGRTIIEEWAEAGRSERVERSLRSYLRGASEIPLDASAGASEENGGG